jgi:ADP-ribose 1''-phosphate phosphatase
VRMCRINSGKFGVEWERTEEVLRSVVIKEGWVEEVGVWMPE